MVIIFEILWGSDLFVVQEIGFLITAGFETGSGGSRLRWSVPEGGIGAYSLYVLVSEPSSLTVTTLLHELTL
jgi:hypothetical protein